MNKKTLKLTERILDLAEDLNNSKDNLSELREFWGECDDLNKEIIKIKDKSERWENIKGEWEDIINFIGKLPFEDEVENNIYDLIQYCEEEDEK